MRKAADKKSTRTRIFRRDFVEIARKVEKSSTAVDGTDWVTCRCHVPVVEALAMVNAYDVIGLSTSTDDWIESSLHNVFLFGIYKS